MAWPLRGAERRRMIGELHEAESDADTSITQNFPEEPKTTQDDDPPNQHVPCSPQKQQVNLFNKP